MENSPCQSSSKWIPYSNKGRIRQRKDRDGLRLSSAVPKIQWDSTGLWEAFTFHSNNIVTIKFYTVFVIFIEYLNVFVILGMSEVKIYILNLTNFEKAYEKTIGFYIVQDLRC